MMIGDKGKFIYYTEKDKLFFINEKNDKKLVLNNNYNQGQMSILNNIYKTSKKKSFPLSSYDDAVECLYYLNKINK